MKFAPRTAGLLACLIALAACQGEKTEHKGTVEGEILPGSTNDAMLPYDTVRSQPPLAPMPVETGFGGLRKGGGEDEEPGVEDSEAANDASPAATVAAPTPEATGQ